MNRLFIALAATAAFLLPNTSTADEKKLKIIGLTFEQVDGNGLDTFSTLSNTAWTHSALPENWTLFSTFFMGASTPSEIDRLQMPGEPDYLSWFMLAAGVQVERSVGAAGTLTFAGWGGVACSSGLVEDFQNGWHGLINASETADNINYVPHGCDPAVGGELRGSYPFWNANASFVPYVMVRSDMVSEGTIGADLYIGNQLTQIGLRHPYTKRPHGLHHKNGVTFTLSASATMPWDTPHLDPTNQKDVYGNLGAGLRWSRNGWGFDLGANYTTEQYEGDDSNLSVGLTITRRF